MSLSHITPQTLFLDESFQNWVRRSNQEDIEYWENWTVRHPEYEETALQAVQMVQLMQSGQNVTISDERVENTLQAVMTRINGNSRRTTQGSFRLLKMPLDWRRVAAVLIVGVMAYWGIREYLNPYVSYATAEGETQTLQLPDGSKVILNANSTLRFAKDWEQQAMREVWMEGEGYFEVKHFENPSRQFIVHANQIAVAVLGTTFNMWQRNDQTKVVLQTGKVEVKSSAFPHTMLMKPGEMLELKKNAGRVTRRSVDPQLYTSWKEKKLFFDATSLSEVAAIIETRYGYRVQLDDSLVAKEKFTYKPGSDDFEVLLQVLRESFLVRIDKQKQSIQIGSHE